MGIPIGQTSTATVTGRMCKFCQCEGFTTEYVYVVERTAQGSGSSLLFLDNDGARNRASERAEKNLEAELEKAVDTVACPKCGWLQAAMVAAEKGRRLGWCLWASIPLSVILLIVGLFILGSYTKKNSSTFFAFSGVVAVAGIAAGIVWRQKHDPNEGHGGVGMIHRERAQASKAILRTEYDELIQAKQAQQNQSPYA